MDKQSSKPKSSKIMKFLPKAVSAVNFHNPQFSPGRDKRHTDHHNTTKLKAYAGRGFSGPMKISIIPDKARTKSKNSSFKTQEPTSPEISCIGQIKHKKKLKELAKRAGVGTPEPKPKQAMQLHGEVKKRPSAIIRMFSSIAVPSDRRRGREKPPLPDKAPSLSQMTRFSSGRGALANFDWTAQIAPGDVVRGNDHSDEEWATPGSGSEEGEERMSLSTPIWIGGDSGALQPRKEVNLWKRRTIDPPKPLQLNTKK